MPLSEIRRGLLVLGITMLIAAPGLSIASVTTRQGQIKDLQEVVFLNSTVMDSAMRASTVYHLSHLQAAEALKWSPLGDATLGVIGGVSGLVLVLTSLRRRSPFPPGEGGQGVRSAG